MSVLSNDPKKGQAPYSLLPAMSNSLPACQALTLLRSPLVADKPFRLSLSDLGIEVTVPPTVTLDFCGVVELLGDKITTALLIFRDTFMSLVCAGISLLLAWMNNYSILLFMSLAALRTIIAL